VTDDATDCPHNDIRDTAYLFVSAKKKIEEQERGNVIFLDLIALATMTIFALEGYVNALAP
jgi:hypothetical protein